MPPAIIAGGIAAAGTIGGAVLGASAQKKAASKAAQTQDAATAAQLQLGQQSLQQNRDIYNSNYDILSPYASRGNVAGGAINALLGLPAAPVMHSPMAAAAPTGGTTAATGATYTGPTQEQINAMWHDGIDGNATAAQNQYNAWHAANPTTAPTPATPATPTTPAPQSGAVTPVMDRGDRPALSDYRGDPSGRREALDAWRHGGTVPATGGAPGGAAGGTTGNAAPSAQQAMQNFANSAGMQFQLQQGSNVLNNMYAGHGALQSGAAAKALQNYGQQTALNNYFMPYMGLLGGQQAVGAGAASSVAGVGANFGNTAANINNSMGNAINAGAQNIGNLQLANGQNQSNMYGSIGGALGGLASSFFPHPAY